MILFISGCALIQIPDMMLKLLAYMTSNEKFASLSYKDKAKIKAKKLRLCNVTDQYLLHQNSRKWLLNCLMLRKNGEWLKYSESKKYQA